MGEALLAVLVAAMATHRAIAETRSFADLGCSVALPDETWQWESVPNVTAAMSSEAGLVLILAVKPAPAGFRIDDKFITSFEKGSVAPGVIRKRSGAMTTFQGVPCYQLNTTMLADGSTATALAFASQGRFYMLQLVGDKDPVERTPNVHRILNSFHLLAQQAPVPQVDSKGDFSHSVGILVGLCVVAMVCGCRSQEEEDRKILTRPMEGIVA